MWRKISPGRGYMMIYVEVTNLRGIRPLVNPKNPSTTFLRTRSVVQRREI